jgi:hypothetical protein
VGSKVSREGSHYCCRRDRVIATFKGNLPKAGRLNLLKGEGLHDMRTNRAEDD